jgi:hypothetical protein
MHMQAQETVRALEDSGDLTGGLRSNAINGTEGQSAQLMEASPNSSLPTGPSAPSSEGPTDPELEWLKPSGLPHGFKACHKKPPKSFMPSGVIGDMMVIVYNQIVKRLPDEAAHAAYAHYIDYARKAAVPSSEMRQQLKAAIESFIKEHSICELHNAYATLLQKSKKNDPFLLPMYHTGKKFPFEDIGSYMDPEAKEELGELAKEKGKQFMDHLKITKACKVM